MKQIATIILVLISLTSFGQGSKYTVKGNGSGGSNVGDSVKKNTDTLGVYKGLIYPTIETVTANTSNILLKRNISDTAGNAGVPTIFQLNKSKDSLQTNINSKLPKSDSALQQRLSSIMPTRYAYKVYPQLTGGIGQVPTEVLNIGNIGGTDSVSLSQTGIVALQGRLNMFRNVKFDSVNLKWLTPIQGTTAYGSSDVEVGSDGVDLHSTPAGVNFSDVGHVGFRVSATGTTTPSANRFTTGYYNQFFRPLIGVWDNVAYNLSTNPDASWSTTLTTQPLIWPVLTATKGTENESIRAEANGTNVWSGIYAARSRGNLVTNSAVTSGDTLGKFGFKGYDGSAYQVGASIDAIATGAISSGTVGTNLRFLTTNTSTAAQRVRMQIGADSTVRFYNSSNRFELPSTFTSVADWSGVGFVPALASATNGMMQQIGTTTGGLLMYGFSSTANTSSSILIRGFGGGTAPTVANTIFRVGKSDGATNVTTLATTERGWQWDNAGTVAATMLAGGNFFVGGVNQTPTARLQLGSGTTSASTAPLKLALVAPALNTTAEKYAVEVDSTTGGGHIYYTNASGTRFMLDNSLTGSATLDFASTGSGAVADLTITVTGAASGDVVSLGVPNASVTATATFTAWVSAANTVTVRFSPKATEDPASGTFKVRVIQ